MDTNFPSRSVERRVTAQQEAAIERARDALAHMGLTARQLEIADEHFSDLTKNNGFLPLLPELVTMLREQAWDEQDSDPDLSDELSATAAALEASDA